MITGPSQYCDGTGNVTLDAGSGFTSYLWSPGGQISSSITTGPGSYSVSVVDANGCSGTSSAFNVADSTVSFVFDPNIFTQDETCPGSADGRVRVIAYGGGGHYDFFSTATGWLSESGQSKVILDLAAGPYSFTVRDKHNPNCQAPLQNYTVNSESEKPVLTCQNFQTNLGPGGNITVNPSDVTASATDNCGVDYSTHYVFPNNFSAEGIFNVVVYISDFSGNTDACHATVTVGPYCHVDFSTSKTEEICDLDEDGSITVTATGGSGNYGFSSDGGNTWTNSTSPYSFSNLSDGDYDIQVRDANDTDCAADIQTVSLARGQVVDFTTSTVDASCTNRDDGSIDVMANSGTAPFGFSIDGDAFVGGGSNHTFNHLLPGDYEIQIQDANGCLSEVDLITNGFNAPPDFDVAVIHESAPAANDGSITVTVIAGTPSFEFSIDGGDNYSTTAGLDQFDVGAITANKSDKEFDPIDLGLSSLTNVSGGAVTITVEVRPIFDPSHDRAASKDFISNPNGYCDNPVQTIDITVLPASSNRMQNTLSLNGQEVLFRAYPVPAYDHF